MIKISKTGDPKLVIVPEKPIAGEVEPLFWQRWKLYEQALASALADESKHIPFKEARWVVGLINNERKKLDNKITTGDDLPIVQSFPLTTGWRVEFERTCDGSIYGCDKNHCRDCADHAKSWTTLAFLLPEQPEEKKEPVKETILCAAIWYDDGKEYRLQPTNIKSGIVVSGHRHPHCKVILMSWLYPNWQNDTLQEQIKNEVNNKEVQGFLTSLNRFLTRKEACEMWEQQGNKPKYSTEELYSEDLY